MKEICITKRYLNKQKWQFLTNMRGKVIFPSLPDTGTFGVNSPQMAQIRAKRPKIETIISLSCIVSKRTKFGAS